MKNYTCIGLSVTNQTAKEIDIRRGKIGRSLFLREIIEKGLAAAGDSSNKIK
jgi:hypothetical protein